MNNRSGLSHLAGAFFSMEDTDAPSTSSKSVSTHFNYCPMDGRPFLEHESKCPHCETERDAIEFSEKMRKSMSSAPSPWRKLLYIKQDYPDNHVDHTFLEEMQKNTNVRSYQYWSLVKESGVIIQHLSSICIFVAAFIRVYEDTLSIFALMAFGNSMTVAGYAFWDLRLRPHSPNYQQTRIQTWKGAFLFFLTLLGLSPILKTLTADTSDDTIWALTVSLFLMNLLLHDYGSSSSTNIKYPGSLSTNAAIFASVLLASRLPSNPHVFGLMLLAVEWFALFPILRRSMKSKSLMWSVLLTLSLTAATVSLLYTISKAILTMYVLCVLFITFVCPFWLIWIQRYKNEIKGPWDEARLILSTS